MKYIGFIFLMLVVSQSAFSQSKKEQIENLIFQKDSLIRVIDTDRQLNTKKVKELETKISKINSDLASIQKELAQSKKELTEKKQEILGFKLDTITRWNTILSLRNELHQIKSSNFETFLPYFLNEVFSEKNFDSLFNVDSPILTKFTDPVNLGSGIFINPGIYCALIEKEVQDNRGDWGGLNYSEGIQPNLAGMNYFSNRLPEGGFCDEASTPDGIYYKEIDELPSSNNPDGYPWNIPPPTKFKPLKKMLVKIQHEKYIIETLYFIRYNSRWHLLYLHKCDCSA